MTPADGAPVLLDGNVLVAMAYPPHLHHAAARAWFLRRQGPFATCPITQGTLLRMLLNFGAVPGTADAVAVLHGFAAHPRHRFWPDDFHYGQVDWKGVMGHKQVTDAYLATLARRNGGRLATFDQGLAALHPDVVELIG